MNYVVVHGYDNFVMSSTAINVGAICIDYFINQLQYASLQLGMTCLFRFECDMLAYVGV